MPFDDGEFQDVIDYPNEDCPDRLGGLLAAFPPAPMTTHERAGFRFQPPPCGEALALDPDFCIVEVKMDPNSWRPEREAIINAIQAAVNCSFGVSDDDLRREAKDSIDHNLSRAIEADLITVLAAEAVAQPGTHLATCALAEAAQFLASSSECGTGIIFGPTLWMSQLGKDHLIWDGTRKIHTDIHGNIVIGHSLDNDLVYAFDGGVVIKTTDVQLLDEHMPGQRTNNDRVVRAEQLYAIAIAPCVVASFATADCCPCSGGGGGGGTDVNVTNSYVDVEQSLLCDVDGNGDVVGTALAVFEYDAESGAPTGPPTFVDPATGAPYVVQGTLQRCPGGDCCPINIGDGCWEDGPDSGQWTAIRNPDGTITLIDPVTGNPVNPLTVVDCPNEALIQVNSRHKDAVFGDGWTPADALLPIITSLSYTVITGTADAVDFNGIIINAIPVGYTGTWNNNTEFTLGPPQGIFATNPGDRVIVQWTERS